MAGTKEKKVMQVMAVPPQAQQEVSSVENFITQAIEKGLPVEQMERLFTLLERAQANRARAAFIHSMAQFQSNCPVIEKTKKVNGSDGKLRYQFAPLGSIVQQIQEPVAKADLSYRWETKQEKGEVTAICIVTHILGHSESSGFTVPIDAKGYMTEPQKFAAALTFAKRYSLCNVLGISTGDEDTDATDVGKTPEPKSLKSKIVFLLRELGENSTNASVMKVEIERLTNLKLEEKNYANIVKKLEAKVIEKRHEDPTIQ